MGLESKRIFLLSFAAFFLIIGAWSVAAPYDGSPDEIDHIVRAVGVASGEVAPEPAAAKRGSGAFQTVPAGLVRTNCWAFDPAKSAACAVPPSADTRPVSAPSGAGRYHPAYYAVVGWPLTWWPGWPGVIGARLVSGALSAVFLAGALAAIVRCSRHRSVVAGLLIAVTPMAAGMAGAVNPNGVEIAAGAAFFAAVIPLFLGRPPPAATRTLVMLAGSSGVALAVLRPTGLLWLVVAAVAVLLPWSRANVRMLRARRDAWAWVALIAIAAITAVAWIVVMKATDLGDYTTDRVLSVSQAVLVEMENWRVHLDEMVGTTGWLDTRMSSMFYTAWQLAGGAFVALALVVGTRVDRWRLAVLVVGGLGVPAALEVANANQTGFISQGRYFLPVIAGVLLFAGKVLDERGLPFAQARTLVRLTAAALLPIHLICLLYSMARWQNGLPPVGELGILDLDPLAGDWHPPLGSLLPPVVEIAGLVALAALVWRVSARPADAERDDATPLAQPRADDIAAVS